MLGIGLWRLAMVADTAPMARVDGKLGTSKWDKPVLCLGVACPMATAEIMRSYKG